MSIDFVELTLKTKVHAEKVNVVTLSWEVAHYTNV